jgi:hypothetical protein
MNHDEATEIYWSAADYEQLTAEYRGAVTEALKIVTPPLTQPDGILLPFPNRSADWDLPRRRDVRNPIRYTPRGLCTFVAVATGLGSVLGGVFW